MYAVNSTEAKSVATKLLLYYNSKLKMIDEVLKEQVNSRYTIFVKYMRSPKSYYNSVNKNITLIFVPNSRYSIYTQGYHTSYHFDKTVYDELERKDTIYNSEWEHQNSMVPLEKAIKKLLEEPFDSIDVIKLDEIW